MKKTLMTMAMFLGLATPAFAELDIQTASCPNLGGNWKGTCTVEGQQPGEVELRIRQNGCSSFRIPHFTDERMRINTGTVTKKRFESEGTRYYQIVSTYPYWSAGENGAKSLQVQQYVLMHDLDRGGAPTEGHFEESLTLTGENQLSSNQIFSARENDAFSSIRVTCQYTRD